MGGVLCREFCLSGSDGTLQDRLSDDDVRALLRRSRCPIHLFEDIRSVGVGGGTSDFFTLVPAQTVANGAITPQGVLLEGRSWIGKDLKGDYDELLFYDQARELATQPEWALLRHMFPYAGVLLGNNAVLDEIKRPSYDADRSPALSKGTQNAETEAILPSQPQHLVDALDGRTLLVLADMLDGLVEPRLLDLKIGSRTSQANWKGKSSFASWRNGVVDSNTNSSIEGVRLEGFLGAPPSVEQEDPVAALSGGFAGAKFRKKAKKVALQKMSMASALVAFTDFRSPSGLPACSGDPWQNNALADEKSMLSSSEYAELVMLSVNSRLAQIVRDSRLVPAPQKWIGTSVCITADAGATPQRTENLQDARSWVEERVRVHIFDWGRAELNTPEQHRLFSDEQKEDREEFWGLYNVGVSRLFWESARYYWHNCCADDWSYLELFVYDRDYASKDDFIGSARFDLDSSKQDSNNAPFQFDRRDMTLHLTDKGKHVVGTDGKRSELNISLSFEAFPSPSRLRGAWRVRVESASSLPAYDVSGSSDPFVVVTMCQLGKKKVKGTEVSTVLRRAQRLTRFIDKCLNPKWDEEFEFPVTFPHANAKNAGEASFRQELGIGSIDFHPKLQELGLGNALQEALPPPDELGKRVIHGYGIEFRFLALFFDGLELDLKCNNNAITATNTAARTSPPDSEADDTASER
eukprot:TRINITY_DN48198_c0_g1_i1.p1 TRINITY_DN48198_c0_g1~~TRINITY_DN48198_c0_g1_i1.p1  ORF type:complete len:711 (-),score=74.33 TRINITY_DN48198_c0_g1_i1:136-2217(-)